MSHEYDEGGFSCIRQIKDERLYELLVIVRYLDLCIYDVTGKQQAHEFIGGNCERGLLLLPTEHRGWIAIGIGV